MAVTKTRRRSIVPTLIAVAALVFLTWQLVTLGGRISEARSRANALNEQVQSLTMANETLAGEIARAEDEELIKDIARAELGLVEPGEKVFYDQKN